MKDRFSQQARDYAQYRPVYPPELYDFIFQHVRSFDLAWDAGTGNGQAAKVLAGRFKKVYATDISTQQLGQARQATNIQYSVADEHTSFEEASINLVTVAQAAHWFKLDKFSAEVKRVTKSHALIAIWGYGLLQISQPIDSLITEFYTRIIGPYWDAERKHIDEHYVNLHFPFAEIESPEFHIRVHWTLAELEGYINTWSAVRQYISTHQHNPVDSLIKQISQHWKETRQSVTFPLFLRLGRVHA